ncbi:zinc finger protein 541-like isoform X1 [Pezoporus flaviventris]|uniref:zinc finger protein 541-like n=1 Tax=Pezoporus flaviventris TaxID=889875 RepID=UPI002AB05D08|nr:zinc finger protein 541-like [Pezoporus flaviventris]XP_061325577.1 zinc finger protein 541-like isoform X1 [Pezoporus flaviventris]
MLSGFSSLPGGMDSGDSGLCLMEDVTSTGPHINIGAQYQAEIPEFRDPSRLPMEEEEDKAWLVWDPSTPDRGFFNAFLPKNPRDVPPVTPLFAQNLDFLFPLCLQ